MDVELPRALAREKNGEVKIVPTSCSRWTFKRFGRCWSEYEQTGGHYQNAHKPIREGLWQAIEKLQARRKPRRP
jgi:hypothetical protein